MSYGSNEAVEKAEEDYREECASMIATRAAALVAVGDMSRKNAISALKEWILRENEAAADPSGVLSIENVFPSPSKPASPSQIRAIAFELMDASHDAADCL